MTYTLVARRFARAISTSLALLMAAWLGACSAGKGSAPTADVVQSQPARATAGTTSTSSRQTITPLTRAPQSAITFTGGVPASTDAPLGVMTVNLQHRDH